MKVLAVFRALGDPVRFRIVAVLESEPLSVTEICDVLELKQSRISRHLGILFLADLLESQRSGANVYYRLSHRFYENDFGMSFLRSTGLLDQSSGFFEIPVECRSDQNRLSGYLKSRESKNLNFFQNKMSSLQNEQEQFVDSSFYMDAVTRLLPKKNRVAADLGCGNGELSYRIVEKFQTLICLDQSQTMLAQTEKKIGTNRAEYRLGRLSHLPIRDNEVDLVIASMVFHHLPEPTILFGEICRILKKGGTLLFADLLEHSEEKMQKEFADFWLGFSSKQLHQWFGDFGFRINKKISGKGNGKIESQIIRASLLN